MQQQTVETVWTRIEPLARGRPGGVVASDCDGTLWSGDVGEDLFHAFLEHGRAEPPAVEAFRRVARAHAVSDAGSGPDIARRIYEAYGAGAFPEDRMCELMTWCFAGWTRGEARAFARDVVARSRLPDRIHPEAAGVLDRARQAGIGIVLVSASPFDVVAEAAALFGFDEDRVVAARPRYEGDVMIADVEAPIPYARGKVIRLRQRIPPNAPLYAALGDNAFDVAMLADAAIAVAVRPKDRLRALASEVPGIIELAVAPHG